MDHRLEGPVAALGRAGGAALAATTRALAAVRPAAKPLHPVGRLCRGQVDRTGCRPPTGVPWLDGPGHDDVLVRVSRAVGLPAGLPDIHGLAVRVPTSHDRNADLLFASTGSSRIGRFVLTASRQVDGRPLTTLLPYRTPTGPVLLRALPLEDGVFELGCARPGGAWRTFGRLHTGDEVAGRPSFDPVLNTMPGLEPYDLVRRLREPAYRAARRSRTSGARSS